MGASAGDGRVQALDTCPVPCRAVFERGGNFFPTFGLVMDTAADLMHSPFEIYHVYNIFVWGRSL